MLNFKQKIITPKTSLKSSTVLHKQVFVTEIVNY